MTDTADSRGAEDPSSGVRLVGLRHRDGTGAVVRHYYVVAGVTAGIEALRRACRFAERPADRLLRGDAAVDVTWAEVRRLRRDARGRFRLTGPAPVTGG
jgi:hypothetical protein